MQLSSAKQGNGVADRADVARRAKADRVDDAQEADGECRLVLELFLKAAGVRIVSRQVRETDEARLRRREPAAADDLRFGEVAALEELEPKRATALHRLVRLDALGKQLEREMRERPGEVAQRVGVACASVDLDDIYERQQRAAAIVETLITGERERVASIAQGAAARERRFVRHRVEHEFENDCVAGQRFDRVAMQERLIDAQECDVVAERAADAEFGVGRADERCGARCSRRCRSGLQGQFVADEFFLDVENRLAAEQGGALGGIGHGCLRGGFLFTPDVVGPGHCLAEAAVEQAGIDCRQTAHRLIQRVAIGVFGGFHQ